MGEIGIPHHTALFDLTMVDIHLLIRGYRRRERTQYINTRWLIFSIAKMMGGAKDVDTPEDFCPFSWENYTDKQSKEEEEEQLQRLLEEARQHNAKLQNDKARNLQQDTD